MHSRGRASIVAALLSISKAAAQNVSSGTPPPGSNPLTWGFYATTEIQQPTELEIEGEFPTWLSGSLYRGGAATWDAGNYTAEHWFDGFSRNHRFEIANGSVTYRSRNGSDELWDFVAETGQYPDGAFGSDPCKIIFGAFETTFRNGIDARGDVDRSNVNVAYITNFPGLDRNTSEGDAPLKTLVMATDANRLQQLDPTTMEPMELFDYQASDLLLNSTGRTAAHAAHGADGTVYNYLLDTSAQPPTYRIFGVTGDTGEARILANITDAPPAYIHTLFSTENYLILMVWQADIVRRGTTILSSLGEWNPERKTLFYVIDKASDGIVSKYISSKAFFGFHEVNTFEDHHGDINIDFPLMQDTSFLQAANVVSLRQNLGRKPNDTSYHDVPGTFTRYRLPNNGANAKAANGSLITHQAEEMWSLPYRTANIELPRVNDAYAGKPYQYAWAYQYAWGIHVAKPGYFADSLIKIDTHAQEWKVWTPQANSLPSEPIFVAAPDSSAEDDGVLLSVVMDSQEKVSSLVAVNATTMELMGKARMPIVMGYGFHGTYAANI